MASATKATSRPVFVPAYDTEWAGACLDACRKIARIHRFFVDRARAERLEYVTLIWHPWSLHRFEPEMRMLELLFDYVVQQGLQFARFEDLWRARR